MKRSILLALFLATAFGGYSQKVKMTGEARKNYVRTGGPESTAMEEEPKIAVYAIMRMKSEIGSGTMGFSVDKSSGELPSKVSKMQFPELEKLSRMQFSEKAEVDVLNYLSESEWEVVSVENISDKKTTARKFYLRKMVAL